MSVIPGNEENLRKVAVAKRRSARHKIVLAQTTVWTDWLPAVVAALVTVGIIMLLRWFDRRGGGATNADTHFRTQIVSIAIALLGLLVVIFVLPEGTDSNLAFSAFGLIVTGALAISSQSIISNAMAGLMLRSVSSFKPGDFVEVADQMGRVTELGLFHTEIQTADRDLVTLPNALMVNQPVRVVRASGTIVSATASLGYDVSRHTLEDLFVQAAEAAGLIEPFVQVLELGDYSVNYRIAGFLEDPRSLLAARSRLRGSILDTLHTAGVEIMSPMYIARRSASNEPLLPDGDGPSIDAQLRRTAESRVFDKADGAAKLEETKRNLADAEESLALLELELTNDDPETAEKAERAVARQRRRIENLTNRVAQLTEAQQED